MSRPTIMTGAIGVGVVAVLASGVTFAATTAPTAHGFTACRGPHRVLKLANSHGKCASGKKVTVGAQGPQGLQGLQGPPGDPGQPGDPAVITGYYDFNDSISFPASANFQTIAHTNVPTGIYMIWAKVWAIDTGANNITIHCTLTTPNDSDLTEAYLFGTSGGETSTAFPMEVESDLPSGGAVNLACNNFGTSGITLNNAKIEAIPIDSVQRNEGP